MLRTLLVSIAVETRLATNHCDVFIAACHTAYPKGLPELLHLLLVLKGCGGIKPVSTVTDPDVATHARSARLLGSSAAVDCWQHAIKAATMHNQTLTLVNAGAMLAIAASGLVSTSAVCRTQTFEQALQATI